MSKKISTVDATYFLGFDGGGTKTDCVLADADGRIVAKAAGGPSNPLRSGYTKSWFSLSDVADMVLSRQKIHAEHIRGICAGLGGAGRDGVARRITTFFERSYPNAQVCVTTDLEVALEAVFGASEGMLLLAGTGSAALGRDINGRTARAGGRGPWISDEGSAFDIGRRAITAVVHLEEHRGPATTLSKRLLKWHECRDWDSLLERIAKNPDEIFPKTFPLVAELADAGDVAAREILLAAAAALAELVSSVAGELGWRDREISIGKVGGMFGRSKYFDGAIAAQIEKVTPLARLISPKTTPAEAAVEMALRMSRAKGNAA
ncbi:MAG: BadF/BadG/BcrA/BcrD ATPase family protein [Candidatus Acidiferrales bacterium]